MATFNNTATLSYNNIVTNSNVVTGEIVDVLSAVKTSVSPSYGTGDNVAYVISLVNSGATPLTGVTATDDLGTYTFGTGTVTPLDYVEGSVKLYYDGILQPAPTVTQNDGSIVFSDMTVPANGDAIIVYEATVNQFAPPGETGTINNSVEVNSTGRAAPIVALDTLEVSTEPELSITKALSPEVVAENGELTYTFTIQNTGNAPAEADDNIVVSDTFTPILNNITVTLDGTALTENTDYTYDPATGEFATVAGRMTVPAAAYSQENDGTFATDPGSAVLRVTGTVS